MTYSNLSKRFPKHRYFCGWYFRCQSDKQTLAIIPSVHKTKDSAFCTIQVITDTHAFHVQFPYDDLGEDDDQIRISNNRFGKSGFSLDIHTSKFHVAGSVHFGAFTPIKYDIMGPFQYIPFMQCRHSIYSMHHRVDGEIRINGVPYIFQNAVSYVEDDREALFSQGIRLDAMQFPRGSPHAVGGRYPPGPFPLYRGYWHYFTAWERIPHCHLSGCQGSENQRWRNRRPLRPFLFDCKAAGLAGPSPASTCGRCHDTDNP